MIIKRLDLDEDVTPVVILAEITIEEAAWIAERAGRDTPSTPAGSSLYGALASGVFNPFWSDGLDDYQRGAEGSRT